MTIFYTILLTISAFIFSAASTAWLIWWVGVRQKNSPELDISQSLSFRSGGIAIILSAAVFLFVTGISNIILLSMLGLCITLFICELKKLKITPRLLAQLTFSIIAVYSINGLVFQGLLPELADKALSVWFLFWFINFFNFMDKTDEISTVETISIGLGFVILFLTQQFAIPFIELPIQQTLSPIIGIFSELPTNWIPATMDKLKPISAAFAVDGLIISFSILGFWVFNQYPTKLSIGEAGNSALGLISGVILLQLAANGYFAAAIILPAYYITDAKTTLTSRLLRWKRPWANHQEYAYQKAAKANPHNIVSHSILGFNIILIALSCCSLLGGEIALFSIISAYILALIFCTILELKTQPTNDKPSQNERPE